MPKPRQAYTLVEEAGFAEFEWHEAKRSRNWDVHQLDFEDVIEIFSRPHVCARRCAVRNSAGQPSVHLMASK
jgi:uncharacterized DUF497 family protein